MGQIYTAKFEAVAVAALQDLFEILAPSDAALRILSLGLFQTTDLGDAEEEVLRLRLVAGLGATSGSGGSSVTPAPSMEGFAASGATVEANNTTIMTAGGGALEVRRTLGWNIRVPLEKIFIPEEIVVVSPSDFITLELIAAPADSLTMSGEITYEEIGG